MAGVTIIFADHKSLAIDATITQSHELASDVTRHPVEEGASVADNIQPAPRTLSLQGIVAYAPILGPLEVIAALTIGPDRERPSKAWEQLKRAHEKRELVTVETTLETYENMAIKRLTVPKEARNGNDLAFTMDLEEIRFVQASTVKLPKLKLGTAKPGATKPQARQQVKKTQQQATPKQSKGQAPKATPTSGQQSWLKRAVSFFGG